MLHRLNSKGEETASLQLFGTIDASACRMAYTDGVIIIPLSNGRLQGVSATEMKTLWVSGAIASGAQNISTVTASGGMVFTGTANSLDSSYNAATGTFFGINAITGERVWANEEANTGFYWSGACKVGSVLLYGNDAGVLTAVDPAMGKTVSTLKLSSAIRSTVISNSAETEAYVTTNDGTLHKISVAPNGSLSELDTASFANKSTSTATLFQGNLFVGGGAADYTGTLSVVDAATMQIKHSVSLPFEAKSAPLVAKAADGNTYAYFTCNGAETNASGELTSGGGAWVYCLETNTATKLLMQPAAWRTTAPNPSPWALMAPCTGPTIPARCLLWQAPPLPEMAATAAIPTTPKHLKNLEPTTSRTTRHLSAMRVSMLLLQPPLALEAHLPQLKHP